MRRVLLLALLIVTLSLAACGDDDDPVSTPSPTSADAPDDGAADDVPDEGDADLATIEVLAEDIGFPEDEYRAKAGTVEFVYTNVGSIRHTLLIEEVDGLDLAVDARGDVDEGSVDLEPGAYTLYCDVAGHRAAGMVADLVVE